MAGMEARLGLDTAGPYLALALWSPDAGVLARRAPRVDRDHAARVVPELEAVLSDAGVAKPEVAAVTVGVGPGSYTGLRVGIATARALATAWRVPLGGACSLAQLAWGALAPGETGLAVLDARRGNVYAAAFRRDDDRLVELAPPAKRPRPEAAAAWPEARWLEGVAPDAIWAAMRPPGERPAAAVYL
jgi:tRNA threonylcarbamoyladenosine biosynthesis protein TsaB